MAIKKVPKEMIDEITKVLVDRGLLIEAGFTSYRLSVIPDDAPEVQIEESRKAFFAGAQHLWGSIMSFLEEGAEPTEADLKRMQQVHEELERFIEELKSEIQ